MNIFENNPSTREKKIVIWGTGAVATELVGRIQTEIAFFIDNDRKKWGSLWKGKEIKDPNVIRDHNDYYVVIAIRGGSAEVEGQIASYGLKHYLDYEWYYESAPLDAFADAEVAIRQYIRELKKHEELKKRCMFINYSWGVNEFLKQYFNEWDKHLKDGHLIQIIEPGRAMEKCEEEGVDFPILTLPYFLSEHIHSRSTEPSGVSADIVAFVEKDEILSKAAYLLRKKHAVAQPLHEYGCIYYYYYYLKEALRWIEPRIVVIWNTMGAYHSVAEYVCKTLGIPVIRAEHGLLPNTYSFDTLGEMGESAPAVYTKEFKSLSITWEEYTEAGEIWNYIRDNGANRRTQWKGNIEDIKRCLKEGNPIIFVAGQNDVASGLYPYTEEVQKYRSPIFASSTQSVIALGELAAKNQWNLIYKPHPYVLLSEEERRSLPDNIILAEGIGINYLIELADVVVTIVSQTAYMALLHDTPVLMLGYIQLRDKGCTYQAFAEAAIEPELKAALRNGFTLEQREAFQRHIAQLVKYYLYDDYCDRPLRYGKPYPTGMDELMNLERILKDMRGKTE